MSRLVVARWVLIVMLIGPLSAQAQRDAIVPDPDPELERKTFQVAEGFEVNLYAADPLLAKPIQMNFDPAGRLWLATSEVYPQIAPGQQAQDKIIVVEDRDGDGRAETTRVFADGLLIPTGVAPGDGGAYIANSTELVHFRDTDGDGKADARRVLLSGFGTEDTHHIIHTFRWGDDGLLYFNQSTYIHSHVETPFGVRRLGGGGIWQFRPEAMRLEIFTRGLINPWGHQIDRWGQHFATDGAGFEGINFMIPGGSYAWTPNATRMVAGLNPGSPKYCGLEIVSGRHWPEDWQGNLITNDFRAHRVCRFVLSDDGSGFAAREQTELIKSSHPAFRPVDVALGPDGALYIADWYNPIIQHGEVDFRDPRRDHTHGRIWRVTARGKGLVDRPKLESASVPALLDQLKAPEGWTRRQVKRVLKERGAAEVIPALAGWIKALDTNDPEAEHHRLEALWVYQALDVTEPELLAALLRSRDARVRSAAAVVVPHWAGRLSDPIALLAPLVEDDAPRVRLAAVRALAAIPESRSAALALRALDRPLDKFLDYALWLTARELAPVWLPGVQAGTFDFDGKTDRLLFALQAVASPEVVRPLLKLLRSGHLQPEQRDRALALIADLGRAEELGIVLDVALSEGEAAPQRALLLNALADAAVRRKVVPDGDRARIGTLLESKDPALTASAARAAGVWGLEALLPRLVELAGQPDQPAGVRRSAIEGLARLGTPSSRRALASLAEPDRPIDVRRQAVIALAGLDPATSATLVVPVLQTSSDGSDPSPVFLAFLQRRGGPAALAKALKDQTIPADVAKVGVRLARGSGAENPALVEALTNAGHLSARPAPPTGPERDKLLADVTALGDPQRGEAVFRRKDLACLNCHAIAGAGGQVGPSLESIGASAPVDYLLDSLFEPLKAVKEGYHALTVATADGRILNGIKIRQTDNTLVLRDAEDREVTIPLADIEEQKVGGSLMPAGQTDVLTRGELLDLVRFLSELGKPGPYSVGQARVVRRWRVLEPTPEQVGELRRFGYARVIEDGAMAASWKPAYSTVAGVLPRSEIPTVAQGEVKSQVGLVQFQVDVSTAGPIALLTTAPPSALELWVDGKRADIAARTVLDLTSGVHTISLAVRVEDLTSDLRFELQEVPGSPARANVLVGK